MPDPEPDSNLTPAQDDAVRALLASARHSAPTPPDVVARLDATLASLSAERRELRPETRAPVVTLASRRRRAAATLVLAAAAVVVAGVGIGQVLPSGMSEGGDAGSSADSATSEEQLTTGGSDRTFDGDSESAEGGADEKQPEQDMRSQESAPSPSSAPDSDLTALDSTSALKPQVRQLRRLTGDAATFSADPTCPLPDAGSSETVSVTYEGLPGALVFRAPVGSTQQVDLFLCGEPEALRSLRLRAP